MVAFRGLCAWVSVWGALGASPGWGAVPENPGDAEELRLRRIRSGAVPENPGDAEELRLRRIRSGADRAVFAMGTRLELHADDDDVARAQRALEGAVREVDRIERACSTWRQDSEWSALNRAGGHPVPLSHEWLTLLEDAQRWSTRTEGAFDPVLGSLVQAWGLRGGGTTPSQQVLASARRRSGSRLLRIDLVGGTAQLTVRDASIEEGAFVKGYALDRARETLREQGIQSGWLSFGGQILTFGKAKEVAISSASNRDVEQLHLELHNASLSSSGAQERGRHILDPRTGELVRDWGLVSVVAADGLTADVLSTALFVLGPIRGLAWANAQNVAAVFLTHQGAIRMSGAFEKLHPRISEEHAL